MKYDYIGKVDKKDIPYYQSDITRYGTIPEIIIKPQKYSSSFDNSGFENFINAATLGGLNNLSPTQWMRRGYDAINGQLTFDNWINGKIIDMMKTELDGMKKNKNVLTILTTNNPENFPDALLDRPGRFHDVLSFENPSKSIRENHKS